jgi:hypothetical protein
MKQIGTVFCGIYGRDQNREEKGKDVTSISGTMNARTSVEPRVAGVIKGNLCHPPIFPRPFALTPLPSLFQPP